MRPKLSNLSLDEKNIIKDETLLVYSFLKEHKNIIAEGSLKLSEEFLDNIEDESYISNNVEQTLKAIHNLIDGIKNGTILIDANASELGLCIGHTAAALSKEYLNWSLNFLECDYWPKGEIAVISSDKKYVLYLAIHIFMILSEEGTANEFFHKLEAIKNGEFPETKSKYSVIM